MLDTIWDQFLTIAKEEAGSRVVETWLKAVSFHQWNSDGKTVYLQTPNSFVKEWIEKNYVQLLTTHLSRLLNVDTLKIIFIIVGEPAVEVKKPEFSVIPAQKDPQAKKEKSRGTALAKQQFVKNRYHLNPQYVFDTFVKGPNNQMAYAAARAITQKPGILYNPLFLYGGSGLGKTHLLHAIANELKQNDVSLDILYQPADRFVNEFINAIRFDKVHRFQAKYRNVDVFLVDDIQSISNKEQTQEAFFHIFNTLYDAKKQIVFSSDSYPADIQGLAERLRTRLEWGLVADIHVPTLETKVAILKRKADINNHELSDDVAHFIASRPILNVRELEGSLIRIVAFASLTKQPITIELAKKVLFRVTEKKEVQINFRHIADAVENHYSYTLSDLRSKERSKQLSLARQIAMYFMKKLTTKSLNEIAMYVGRKDHSTVIHAFRQIDERAKGDEHFAQKLERMESEMVS